MISLCWTFEELILFWQLYPPYISPEVLVSLHPLSIRGPLWTAAVCADEVGGWLFWFPGCLCSPRISYGVMAKSFTANSIWESFLLGNLQLGKSHFSENLEVQTHPDSFFKLWTIPEQLAWQGENTEKSSCTHPTDELSAVLPACWVSSCAFSWVWLCVAAHTFDSSWETALLYACITALAWRLHDLIYVVSQNPAVHPASAHIVSARVSLLLVKIW